MSGEKQLYRKQFSNAAEAELTAQGFGLVPNIDKPGFSDVWVREEGGSFFVYVALEANMDPNELFDATGFEHVA